MEFPYFRRYRTNTTIITQRRRSVVERKAKAVKLFFKLLVTTSI
jgi:hypothetical protein